eukprot:5737799-Prymnesium_polylepis.1
MDIDSSSGKGLSGQAAGVGGCGRCGLALQHALNGRAECSRAASVWVRSRAAYADERREDECGRRVELERPQARQAEELQPGEAHDRRPAGPRCACVWYGATGGWHAHRAR